MLPINRILAPVDFSERCLRMMPYVRVIAVQYGAEIVLLHVVNPVYTIPATGISGPVFMRAPDWVFTEKSQQLENFAVAELQGLPVRRLVYEGDPEAQVAAFVQAEDVQLIAMPTHGYGVFRRYLIGSVTAKVLHDVSCPVLTGAHIERLEPSGDPVIAKIVCALDLSPGTRDTLAYVSRLASDFGAALSLVHVMPPVSSDSSAPEPSRLKGELEALARNQIEEMKRQVGALGVDTYVREGDVAHEVSSFAQFAEADLLVLGRGAHGHERLRAHAYGIIRQAPCPVLSV